MLHIALSVCVSSVVFHGCLFVADSEKKIESQMYEAQPEIEMSEEYIRTKSGDVLAYLPKDWFLVDIEKTAPADVIAIAVNPDYTASAVLTSIRKTDLVEQTFSKEGMIGLARLSFEKHNRKTVGAVKLLGTFSLAAIGKKTFGVYEFIGADSTLKTRSAVFASSINNFYQLSVVPTTINEKPLPTDEDYKKYFRSMLASLQY